VIEAALAQKLTVILDEHDFNTCGQPPPPARPSPRLGLGLLAVRQRLHRLHIKQDRWVEPIHRALVPR